MSETQKSTSRSPIFHCRALWPVQVSPIFLFFVQMMEEHQQVNLCFIFEPKLQVSYKSGPQLPLETEFSSEETSLLVYILLNLAACSYCRCEATSAA